MGNNSKHNLLEWYICSSLPYDLEVHIDYKKYLEWLPQDISYHERLQKYLKASRKTIEDISNERDIVSNIPCRGRVECYRVGAKDYGIPMDFITPILRSMDSMTDEEKKEYESTFASKFIGNAFIPYESTASFFWLIKNHFDFCGLIDAGLAVEK